LSINAWQAVLQKIRQWRPDRVYVWGPRTEWLATFIAGTFDGPVWRFIDRLPRKNNRAHRWLAACRGKRQPVQVVRHKRQLPSGVKATPGISQAFQVVSWFGYQPEPQTTAEGIRQRLGLPVDAKLVGTVCPLTAGSRIKDFVWAADLLRCIRDDVYWLVIGEGPDQWRLRRFASQLEVGDRLRFLGNRHDASEMVAGLDIYVQPSDGQLDYSGLRSAICHGIPAIGISQSIHEALITHHQTGYLIERGARNEIARCVNRLLSEPEIAAAMSRTLIVHSATRLPTIESVVHQMLHSQVDDRMASAG
jgi:glycosyltransferase involved in cell wall biosynthesis